MFREMRRFKQALSEEKCKEILADMPRGVLAVLGDEDYPYTVPLDFYYDESRHSIFFHVAMAGHKLDAIRRHDKVCFNVIDEGERNEGEWFYYFNSVDTFGRIREVDREEEIFLSSLRNLGRKYYPSFDEVEVEINKDGMRVVILELQIEHMTGKHVQEK